MEIDQETRFENNVALNSGGAISWTSNDPSIAEDTLFVNNSALVYGENLSCYAQGLRMITKVDFDNTNDKIATGTLSSRRVLFSQESVVS